MCQGFNKLGSLIFVTLLFLPSQLARANPMTIYAATNNGVFKTTDGGANWTQTDSGLGAMASEVFSLAIDPSNPATLYAGTRGGGIFKSTNGGQTWAPANNGLIDDIILSIAIDPTNPNTIYCGTAWSAFYGDKGVFKSTDGAQTWIVSNSGLPTDPDGYYPIIDVLKIDPSNPAIIYAGTNYAGVFKSIDGGQNWTAANSGMESELVSDLAIDPTNSATLYAATYNSGFFKSINGGMSWTAINNGISESRVIALAVDPANTDILYAGTFSQGVYKTTNGGSMWSSINSGLQNTLYAIDHLPLVLDPLNPGTIYAGTFNGVFKGTLGGTEWTSINTGFPASTHVYALAIEAIGPIAVPLIPGGGTNLYQFAGNLFNFKVTYPALLNPPSTTVDLVVDPILISQEDLENRLAGQFSGATLVPYDGTGGFGVLFRVTCQDPSSGEPITCPEPTGPYNVYTSWNSPPGQTIINPAFLRAEIGDVGTQTWENIFTSFSETRIDPTGTGRTKPSFSDFVFVHFPSGPTIPPPTVTITTPANHATYALDQAVIANYSCGGAFKCVGTVDNGTAIDTSTVGDKSFEVNAVVSSGPTADRVVTYHVGAFGIYTLFNPSVKSGWPLPIVLELRDANGKNVSSPRIRLKAVRIVLASTNVPIAPQPGGFAKSCKDFLFVPWPRAYTYVLNTFGLRTGSYLLQFTVSADSSGSIYSVPFKIK
jgi:photosystem II stability/assembly factor-like uncharacterized protein